MILLEHSIARNCLTLLVFEFDFCKSFSLLCDSSKQMLVENSVHRAVNESDFLCREHRAREK